MNASEPNKESDECLGPLAIDEWNAEEPQARATYAPHVQRCQRCQQRIANAKAAADAFLQELPTLAALETQVVADRMRSSHGTTRRRTWLGRAGALGGALAIAATAMLMVDTEQPAHDGIKGTAKLGVFVKRNGQVVKGRDGQRVHPGDALRFTYSSARDGYLSVWGDDGLALSLYHPVRGDAPAAARRGKSVPLDFGVELDDRLGTETFYGVFCTEPTPLSLTRQALSTDPPSTPSGCTVDVLRLHKQAVL